MPGNKNETGVAEPQDIIFPPEVVHAAKVAGNEAFRAVIAARHELNGDIRLSVIEAIGMLSLVASVAGIKTETIHEMVESGRLDAENMLAEGKSFKDFAAVKEYMARYHPDEAD